MRELTRFQMKLQFQYSPLIKWADIFWIRRETKQRRNRFKEHAEYKKYHRYNGTHKN